MMIRLLLKVVQRVIVRLLLRVLRAEMRGVFRLQRDRVFQVKMVLGLERVRMMMLLLRLRK